MGSREAGEGTEKGKRNVKGRGKGKEKVRGVTVKMNEKGRG